MTREQEIKAAIVVTPDAIAFATPEMNQASEIAAEQLGKFVDWIQAKFPFLLRHEAVLFAGAVIESIYPSKKKSPIKESETIKIGFRMKKNLRQGITQKSLNFNYSNTSNINLEVRK